MSARNPFRSDWIAAEPDKRQQPPTNRSYVAGASDDALRFITVSALLDETVLRHGGREAAVFCADNTRLSWHDLRQRSDEVAAGLLALGVQRGDRVGIWAPNCVECLLTQFATARIGAILVNINPVYGSTELAYTLNKVQCKVLILASDVKSGDHVAILQELAPELARADRKERLVARQLPHLEHAILIGSQPLGGLMSFAELIQLAGPAQRARLDASSAALDPDDAINIQFTSGPSGAALGATLSHYSIVNTAHYAAQALRLSERDRLCIPVPLYRSFGMVLGVLACVAAGATMIFPAPVFDAEASLASVQRERCTALHGVPSMFIAMLTHARFAAFDLTSLRTGIIAGAPCPIDTLQCVMSDMHMRDVTVAYGTTEIGPAAFQSSIADPIERRAATVGRVQPHVEAKIVDARGTIVPLGHTGELCMRGYSVMHGYWDDAPHTSVAIDAAGWIHSGDLATLDAQGYCTIVGRAATR